jgi:ubiquinol-cytochrome c reductase cytochrome c subunit
MSRATRGGRRAHALALAAPVLAVVLFTPWITAAQPDPGGGDGGDEPTAEEAELLARGRELYVTGCSSCHGPDGGGEDAPDGSARGPSLESAGEATAYYYLATGRMPLANSEEQPIRKEPAYDEDEIEALVAYVAALGDGEGPRLPDLDLEGADLAQGGEIFRGNCQACHSASGSGGALSYGDAAPRLAPAEPLEIGAAVRAGPGEMPVFGPETISDNQLNDLVRYVDYLDDPDDPGGVPIGRTGPIPEGFVAWLVGMITLLVLVGWIGTRDPIRRRLRR